MPSGGGFTRRYDGDRLITNGKPLRTGAAIHGMACREFARAIYIYLCFGYVTSFRMIGRREMEPHG
jgi:hypothetical protein